MLGWCCCDHWEHWENGQPGDLDHRDRLSALADAAHPQAMPVFSSGSMAATIRLLPTSRARTSQVESETHWPNPDPLVGLGHAHHRHRQERRQDDRPVRLRRSHLLAHRSLINTAEPTASTPKPAPAQRFPSLSSMQEVHSRPMKLWPPNATWSFHFGGGEFKNLTVFDDAMKSVYGRAEDLRRLRPHRPDHELRHRARHV